MMVTIQWRDGANEPWAGGFGIFSKSEASRLLATARIRKRKEYRIVPHPLARHAQPGDIDRLARLKRKFARNEEALRLRDAMHGL